jgi:hypothetical protein
MPDDLAEPVVTAACISFARGPWVKPSPGIPCTLSFSEGNNLEQLGRIMPREREVMPCSIIHHTLSVIPGRAKHEPGIHTHRTMR